MGVKVTFDGPAIGVKVKMDPKEAEEYDKLKAEKGLPVGGPGPLQEIIDRLNRIELRLDNLEGRRST